MLIHACSNTPSRRIRSMFPRLRFLPHLAPEILESAPDGLGAVAAVRPTANNRLNESGDRVEAGARDAVQQPAAEERPESIVRQRHRGFFRGLQYRNAFRSAWQNFEAEQCYRSADPERTSRNAAHGEESGSALLLCLQDAIDYW
jgi:hypothetical protein